MRVKADTRVLKVWLAAVAVALQAGCAAVPQTPSLYQRLGGLEAITAVVEKTLQRAAANPTTRDYFIGADLDRTRDSIASQLCDVTGGPCSYDGRAMRAAHAGMDITGAAFASLVTDLQAALDSFAVAQPEQQELLALLAPLRDDIVNYP